MDKEAIRELAEQLGKEVNWVEKDLMPYVYSFAEYRVMADTIAAVIAGIVALVGIACIIAAATASKRENWIWEGNLEFPFALFGSIAATIGAIICAACTDAAIGWSTAPEVMFFNFIKGA